MGKYTSKAADYCQQKEKITSILSNTQRENPTILGATVSEY